MPRHCRSSHCGARTPCAVPTWKTGSLTGADPRFPTVKTSCREGGAPNQVRIVLSPSSRVVASTASLPPPVSFGSAATGWPATTNTASAVACSPVTVATCTTQGQGAGGSATGIFLPKSPLAPVVTARPSALAQELVPPITPRSGVDCPQISIIRSVLGRQPLPLTVISLPLPACCLERVTTGLASAAAAPAASAPVAKSISRAGSSAPSNAASSDAAARRWLPPRSVAGPACPVTIPLPPSPRTCSRNAVDLSGTVRAGCCRRRPVFGSVRAGAGRRTR